MDSFAACAIDETRKNMPASNHRMCSRALAREATWRRRQNILSGQITSVVVESSWEGLLGLRVHVIIFGLLADVCRQCLDCFLFCPICGRALFCAIFAASNCSVLFVVCSIQHLLLFGSSVINNLGLGALSFCLSIFCGASTSPPVTP